MQNQSFFLPSRPLSCLLIVAMQASFAPADPPPVEAVPGDAVDSTGKPVDVKLYEHFWKLQVRRTAGLTYRHKAQVDHCNITRGSACLYYAFA